jgi:phosphoribosyl 1,2-cyclic phosphodiesterase
MERAGWTAGTGLGIPWWRRYDGTVAREERVITYSLQSGSNGNAIYVEAGDVRLLFDAGISGKTAEGRMRVHGREIRDVTALIISHDHADHMLCAGIYQRKFGLPIHMTRRTHQAYRYDLGSVRDVRYFEAGQPICFGDVVVHTVPTPHDAADGSAFVVEHEGRRLGVLTDLGHPFDGLRQLLPTLDAAYLESNYDPEMLAMGPYPPHLQARIRGDGGHLSNHEAAGLVGEGARRLQWVVLSHLSEHNNKPELALEAHRRRTGREFPLHVAPRYELGPVLRL